MWPNSEDHPRRCQAKFKRKPGKICRNFALRDSRFCKFHGGARDRALGRGVRVNHLPRFYQNVLTKTVAQLVEDQLGASPNEQLQIYEELALMRVAASQAVRLYGAALELGKDDIINNASVLMRDALESVVDTCETAAKIEASAKDKFSIHSLQQVVNQIVRLAHEVFGDDQSKVEMFERLMRTKIKMPVGESGTTLTPDQDVTEMDDTVPDGSDDMDTPTT